VSLNVIHDLGVPSGAKIFGYSLFSPDVPANANLINWNSFPTNTNSGSPGGIDPAAYNGVLYQMVPGNPGPTTDWALPANGDFATSSNWTGATTPNSTDSAIINNGTTATLTGTATTGNLETGVGYSDSNGGAAVNGGNLTVIGTTTTGVDGTGTLIITNGGTATDATTVIGQNPGSNGTVNVDGAGSTLTTSGDTTIGNGGTGTLNITNGGTVTDTNGTLGNLPESTGVANVDGPGSLWNNSGTLDVGPAGTGILNLTDGGAEIANGGTTVEPNGMVTGDGTITTPTLINNGVVAPTGPNSTPGTLTIDGNYQQGPPGLLDIEVGGPQSTQADQLKITGTATLSGTLALSSLNSFHPSSGDTYTILTAGGGVQGNFTQVLDSLNNSGLTRVNVIGPNGILVSYLRPANPTTPTPVTLTATTPKPLPTSPLTNGQKNAILVPVLDPDAGQTEFALRDLVLGSKYPTI
jgi:T5SS/PEP-CTERM-associated repeat protein